MRPSFYCGAFVLSLASAIACPAVAQQPATPGDLFDQGVAQMNAGNFDAGCKAIAESHRLDPLPGTLFTLATCQDRWGHVATAVALYGEYLALYEKLPDDRKVRQGERAKVAKAQREKMAPDVPELTLTLPPNAPPGTVVKREGQVIALDVGLRLDPGEHTVTTQAPDEPALDQQITIGKGEKKKVMLKVRAAPIGQAPPPKEHAPPPPTMEPLATMQPSAPPQGMSERRKVTYVIGAIGIAGLALGGVMGGLTLGQKSTIDQHCGAAIGKPETKCDQTGLDAAHAAQPLGLASTIGVTAGVIGIGTALVLIGTEPSPASPKAGARRRWISAEVLSVGPAGAMLGARGAW